MKIPEENRENLRENYILYGSVQLKRKYENT